MCRCHVRLARQSGWTLIELMIALAILGILVSYGVSTATGAIQASHSFDGRSALLASITSARQAATRRDHDVRLCPSRDGRSCLNGYHWESGWIVFEDVNDNDRVDPADLVFDRQPALAPGVHAITSVGRKSLEFQPNAGNGGSNATFTFCDRRGPAKAKAFALSNQGGMREVPTTPAAVAEACRNP